MKKLSPHLNRVISLALRGLPLGMKLLLTLYMGRYLALADIGAYGLVFSAIMVIGGLLGFRLDYVVSREIVGEPELIVLTKMRDQALFYSLNYLVLGLMLVALHSWLPAELSLATYILGSLIIVFEGYANLAYSNMNSLNQQLWANFTLAIRSSVWIPPVVILGWLFPAFRNVETIFTGWLLGVLICDGTIGFAWRHLPWQQLPLQKIDWAWLFKGIKRCLLIWLGTVGLVIGAYVDRFVVSGYLGLEQAGVATFYFSFTNSLLSLMQSGVLFFAYPRLITFHRENNRAAFRRESIQAGWQIGLSVGVIALLMAVIVPQMGIWFNRPILVSAASTLWLMLFGTWLRANSETFYYVLFARHQDRPVWLGNLLCLIPAVGGNALLVPWLGLAGIGWSAVLTGIFLLIWRGFFALRKNNL